MSFTHAGWQLDRIDARLDKVDNRPDQHASVAGTAGAGRQR